MPAKTVIPEQISSAANMINSRKSELSRQADPTDDRARGQVEGLTEALAILMMACTGTAQLAASNGHATTY